MTLTDAGFGFVRDIVRKDSAIVLADDKGYLVESRLLPLARQAGVADVGEFVRDLQFSMTPQTRRDVVEALTTNETSFFRDRRPFSTLTDTVLPTLAAARRGGRISVWSAAASSGQEAYSVVMAAKETPATAALPLDVVGTDLSARMIERATQGLYSQLEVNRGLPATHLVKYFVRDGAGWRVRPELKTGVRFHTLNLDEPFGHIGRFDVVFLRNVLIYFDLPTRANILRRVRQVIAPDGYLFLGAAETTAGVDDGWVRDPAHPSSLYRPRKDAAR